jgi:hypothetical protein
MTSITRDLRKDLEKTVKQARRVAEAGARQAVQQLRVGDGDAPKDLTADQRALRTRLRAHGRQLGDRRDAKTGAQETAHLVQECAYEHWHRMLFARFLAETDLLIEPESGVAITLDEVQELSREKATDWLELASEYAERMLPQIFRRDDPVLQIALPPETRSEMEDLLKDLSKPVFQADDSLGWVYQFWQADKKDEVNKSGTKIGADELPAVTQLFTEDYMVLFLLHNTLGAWWAGKILAANPDLASSDVDEASLRAACKVGDIDWAYLRLVRDKDEDGSDRPWRPAAGPFEGWPKAAKDVTVLDPCMGSGHFLVFALPILVAFRMAEEGLSHPVAVDAVLRDNLFGLEIDPRCTQIAAFNLAFAAWRKVGHRPLPQLHLACSGLAIGVSKAEWLKLAEKAVIAADPAAKRDLLGVEKNLLTVGLEERVKNGLEALYDLFAKAAWLGSLIDPRRASADIFRAGFDKLEPLLASILAAADTDDTREMAVAAQGMAKSAELMARQFTLVTTNVPYLGKINQDDVLRSHSEEFYALGKADLATCFFLRTLNLASPQATVALVIPQNTLFLKTYTDLRHDLLTRFDWRSVAKLGSRAFQTIGGEVVSVALTIISKSLLPQYSHFATIDAGKKSSPQEKADFIATEDVSFSSQSVQISNSQHAIVFGEQSNLPLLEEYADSYQGSATLDIARFRIVFWEVQDFGRLWILHASNPDITDYYRGLHYLSFRRSEREFEKIVALMKQYGSLGGAWQAGRKAWGKQGVAIAWMGSLPSSMYLGTIFDNSAAAIIPKDPKNLAAIWCFISSSEYAIEVRKINQKTQVANVTLVKVPFDLKRWQVVAAQRYPAGLPKPDSTDPTQWLFAGHPATSVKPLYVATARLVGYRWPRQIGTTVPDAASVNADGLESYANIDGIVCLTAVKGEAPAEQQLNALLGHAFGADWSAAKLSRLLTEAGYTGKSLDGWLRDGFFAEHCELFHQRPFVWHIWDGLRDGFHALVNYHRLAAPNGEGRRTLEKLIYSYLGDWIDRQRADQKAGVEGADARVAHAEHLKAELIRILEGEPPYDIFARWKPLHEQPLGWDPDINDGVRMNIRPFMTARTLNASGANACILRATPKIKWEKDRGKEPLRDIVDHPWFWTWDEVSANFSGGAEFDGNRWNDLHYSRSVKQAARSRHRSSTGGKA